MAATRLTLDPALESCPDYASASFQSIYGFIVAGAPEDAPLTDAEAASQLAFAWNTERDAHQVAWDAQRLSTPPGLVIPDFLGRRASNFAKKKLDDKEYVELWYWTKEGCIDAEATRASIEADESFGITQVGSTLSLNPLTAFKASKKVVRDKDLTWAQLSIAKTCFLSAIEAAGWPQEHRAAIMSFFYAIETHPLRMNHDDYADNILVIYQARARHYWHDTLAQANGSNIAIINDRLLEQISQEFHNKLSSSR
ncbi:hypothetical protein B0H19DRAFT_1074254 [Mycena capillaripes]|nr:hypothetical protein B0H19DRAFT_1074254 [Mycena capillaripes]